SRFAVVQPCQEFQLCQQMIGRCTAVDFETESLVVELVFEHDLACRAIQKPGAFEQRTPWLGKSGFKKVDVARAQVDERDGRRLAEFGEALEMPFIGISEREPENSPGIYCARYHMLKYFLPSRSCCAPFQMATANGVPAFRAGICK